MHEAQSRRRQGILSHTLALSNSLKDFAVTLFTPALALPHLRGRGAVVSSHVA
jgi:hypothetical protein